MPTYHNKVRDDVIDGLPNFVLNSQGQPIYRADIGIYSDGKKTGKRLAYRIEKKKDLRAARSWNKATGGGPLALRDFEEGKNKFLTR